MVFLRFFRAISTRKTGTLLVGLGATAVGIGTAFGFSCVTARERKVDPSKFMAEPLTEAHWLENNMDDMKSRMEVMILGVQADICRRLSAIDGQEFRVDRWLRKEGGGGVSCVLQDGKCGGWGWGDTPQQSNSQISTSHKLTSPIWALRFGAILYYTTVR